MALQEEELSAVCRTIEYMSPELLHNGHEGKDGKTSPYDPRSTGKVEMHTRAGRVLVHARMSCCQDQLAWARSGRRQLVGSRCIAGFC